MIAPSDSEDENVPLSRIAAAGRGRGRDIHHTHTHTHTHTRVVFNSIAALRARALAYATRCLAAVRTEPTGMSAGR